MAGVSGGGYNVAITAEPASRLGLVSSMIMMMKGPLAGDSRSSNLDTRWV